MNTRAAKKTAKKTGTAPAKKTTTPRKAPAKAPAKPKLATVTDLRRPLPTRPTVGPPTTAHLAEGRAALASAWCRLPIPVLAWHATPDGTATAQLADTLLVHAGGHNYRFTAFTPCRRGAHHAHPVTDQATLTAARIAAAQCTDTHGDIDTDQAITRGVQPAPTTQPAPVRSLAAAFTRVDRPLADQLARSTSSNEDTQTTDVTSLRAEDDQAREHPHD